MKKRDHNLIIFSLFAYSVVVVVLFGGGVVKSESTRFVTQLQEQQEEYFRMENRAAMSKKQR